LLGVSHLVLIHVAFLWLGAICRHEYPVPQKKRAKERGCHVFRVDHRDYRGVRWLLTAVKLIGWRPAFFAIAGIGLITMIALRGL